MLPACRALIVAAGLLIAGGWRPPALPAQYKEGVPDFTNIDLKKEGIPLVEPAKDARTGFVVGGKNATSLIKRLKEINGRTIAELEKDMRPGARSKVGSTKGFLGADERLLDVMAADNRYVVDELGLTHQLLAKHLHVMGRLAAKTRGKEFRYHGRRFTAKGRYAKGFQESPFYDDTRTNAEVVVRNLDTGKQIGYSLLVPHMIDRYGFYEGTGTPYRVDPAKVLDVFDFIKPKGKAATPPK